MARSFSGGGGGGSRAWLLILGAMAAAVLVFVIGLIVGVFAIPHKSTCKDYDPIGKEDEAVSKLLIKAIDPERIKANLVRLTTNMHRAGTPGGDEVAQFIHDSLRDFGLDKVEFEDYNVLLSYPNETNPDLVALVDSDGKILVNITNGRSEILVENEETHSPNADVRFNAFAKANETTAVKLVYANFGTQDDFDYLINQANISLNGSIVLVRYRKLWRGAKVEVAERLGAVGVLLYSDPEQETYQNQTGADATYPNTIYMPSTAVQRGSIVYRDAGDVLTPLLPSKDYVIRHDIEEMYETHIITQIPVTPISYGDAQKLFEVLDGPEAPSSWQGGLSLTYRLGPEMKNEQKVHMKVTTYPDTRRIRNVIGYIRGSYEPDRYVVIGNHHDAWVYGALDPSSGTATMLEIARAFASIHNSTGWRPRRTIVFCAWDAEEMGLVGSSEFIEQYLRRFEFKTVAYLNVDIGVTGNETLWAKTVPLLQKTLFASAKKIPNPDPAEVSQGRTTLFDTWKYRLPDKTNPNQPWLDSIGSGSDYRHFLDFVGISSLDFRYSKVGDRSYPLYHTMHETMHLVDLIDPTLVFHQAVGRMWAEMGRHLADSIVIPFNVTDYGGAMVQYVDDMATELSKSPGASYANITHIKEAAKAFSQATQSFDAKVTSMVDGGHYDFSPVQLRIINDQLLHLERMFILPFGLPGRSYLRHVVFAPSIDDSYSGVLFAGITDTLNQLVKLRQESPIDEAAVRRKAIVLNDQISWVAHCIYSATDLLTRDL